MRTQCLTSMRTGLPCVLVLSLLVALIIATACLAGAKNSKAAGQSFKGKVTAVSSASITLHNKESKADRTFTVTSSTKVTVDKAAAAITAIAVGMHVNVLSADGKTADVIHAHTAKAGGGSAHKS